MIDILKLTLSDIFTLGGNDSIILNSKEVLLMQDYPRHSLEYAHLRKISGLYLDTIRKTEPKIQEPNHYLEYGKGNTLKLIPIKYKYWLQGRNFAKYFPENKKTYTFIKIDGKIVEEIDELTIREYVKDDLEQNSINGNFDYFNFMMKNKEAFDPKFLFMLESRNVEFKKDTKDTAFLYYQNCIVKVTADNVEIINYEDVNEYVWRNQIIQRDFVRCDHHGGEYRYFIYCASGKNMVRYKTIQSVIGWAMHSYKTSANNKAVVINDTVISDNPNGGSGKGLFCIGLSHVKKTEGLNGKKTDMNKDFEFQTVKIDCQVLVFEDVKKTFDFEDLFSIITEGITLNYKNQPAIKLPIEKSPKIVITTNYTLSGVGGSHDRRKFEIEFSDYFNAKHTPEQEFKHMLFNEWDKSEWQKFDNYMVNCLQIYLRNGLIPCEFDNMALKKFIRNTRPEFHEFTKDHDFITFNERHSKKLIYEKFIEDYPDTKKWVTRERFVKFLREYCTHYRFEYEEDDDKRGLGRWFMVTREDYEYIPNQDNLF